LGESFVATVQQHLDQWKHNRRFAKTIDALGASNSGDRYLLAATFGNVHGVYKPGNVTLKPDVLGRGQQIAAEKLGLPAVSKPFDFVFHGDRAR